MLVCGGMARALRACLASLWHVWQCFMGVACQTASAGYAEADTTCVVRLSMAALRGGAGAIMRYLRG